MAMNVKKGDTVVVLSGKDKGKHTSCMKGILIRRTAGISYKP